MEKQIELKNAKITSTMLGVEDHGIMTCMIYLDYGGSGQGFGGWAFDNYDKSLDKRVGTAYGMKFIMELLQTLDVSKWEDLSGLNIRVKANNSKVYAIGHFLENKWFNPSERGE